MPKRKRRTSNGETVTVYFTKALMDRMDDNCVQWIRKTGEFWPGGDIRISGNLWLRAAFTKSSLSKVPRENSIRQSLYEIIRKKKLRFGRSDDDLDTWVMQQAHRGHQVLLNHAKNKRKGVTFLSPATKEKQKVAREKLLLWHSGWR